MEKDKNKKELNVSEWKYWSDEILDRVQKYYESEVGYNGFCKHVWVPIKGNSYKLPAVEQKIKHVLVAASRKPNHITK